MIIKNIFSHEAVGAFYLTMFSLLAPLTHTSENSTLILFGALLCCLLINIFLIYSKRKKGNLTFLFITIVCIGCLLLFDSAFRYNTLISEYTYGFLLYGVLSIYFISFVSDYNLFLKIYVILSITSGFIHALDPLMGYEWSSNYMEFGFVTMLPAFAASVISLFHFKHKLAIIPLLLFLLEILICSNKGSLLTAIVILILGIVYINNNLKFNFKTVVLLLIISLVLYLSANSIFQLLLLLAEHYGIDSYSLGSIYEMINHGGLIGSNSDTRTPIWESAWDMYLSHPILGNGVGTFALRQDGYEHNIFLEILNSWGIIGFFILMISILKSRMSIKRMKDSDRKVIAVVFMMMAFIPLLISMTFWKYQFFWAFFAITLCKPYNYKKI